MWQVLKVGCVQWVLYLVWLTEKQKVVECHGAT